MKLTWILVSLTVSIAMTAMASVTDVWTQILLRAKQTESTSFVVVQNGKTIDSDFFGGKDQPIDIESATKSIAALAIAKLVDDKKIASFDVPMSTYVRSWASDTIKSRITLRMIMSHTSGLPDVQDHATSTVENAASEPNFFYQPDLVKTASETNLVGQPGKQFLYSSIGASLLQTVIAQASGETVTDFVQKSLFTQLEISDLKWSKDKAGHELTSGGLYLSTADLLKVGELILQNGTFHGKQIVSKSALATLTTKSQLFVDYGLNWWLSSDGQTISARGYGGQFIVVNRAKKIVAVRTKNIWKLDPAKLESGKFRDFPDLISRWNP